VIFDSQTHDTPIYRRDQFNAGATLSGPAIIEQNDSTIVIWTDERMRVGDQRQLIITREGR
jgi:N-methylhydantoinase A